jgi:hypothetical protein
LDELGATPDDLIGCLCWMRERPRFGLLQRDRYQIMIARRLEFK